MFGPVQNQAQRRQFSGLLALLWALYAWGGTVGLSHAPQALGAAAHGQARATSRAPVCRCVTCHGVMRGGKRVCCCLAAQPSTPTAILTSRCDGGVPATRAAVASWPVMRAPLPETSARTHAPRPRFARAADVYAPSLTLLPPTPPPCLL